MTKAPIADRVATRAASALRIACAVPEYAPHVSGSEVYAKAVCEALAFRGHDVRVICEASDCAEFTGEDERLQGVRIWRGVGSRRSLGVKVESKVRRLFAIRERALLKRRALEYEVALRDTRPDVVLALPVPRQSVVASARYSRQSGCPALVVPFYHIAFGGFVPDAAPWLTLLGSFDAVLASTHAELAFLQAGGISASKLRRPGMFVNPLPAPTAAEIHAFRDRLGIGSGFLVATVAAEFSEPKGSRAMLRAAALLPQLTFVFLGGTPKSRAWLERTTLRGPNVHVLGFVSEREKAIVLAAADLFALPSRADSFGLAYQEAHSLGTPSLALDLPVMREVLGPAGIFADPDEGDDGIVRALAELVRRPVQLRMAAKASVEVAARYAPEPVLGAICDLVEEVAAFSPS